jgi:hypothetical protein
VYARAREDYEGFLHLSDMLGIGPEGVLHDIESSDTHEEDSNSDGELSAEEEEVEEPIADNVVTVEFEEGSLEDGYFATQSYLSPVDILTLTASVAFPEPVPQQTVATLTPTVVTEAAEVTPYETIAQIAPNISIDIDVPTIADIVNQTLTTTFGVSGTDVPKLQYTGSRFTINARVAVGIVIKACYEATGLNIAFHNLDLFK